MSTRPVILITPSLVAKGSEFFDRSVDVSEAYIRAISEAGGLPSVAPLIPDRKLMAELVGRVDGVMLSGGDDLQPELYRPHLREALKKTVSAADPARDLSEILIVNEVFRQRKPLLAICRGMQLLNVALGGTLIVDIPLERPGSINHGRSDLKDRPVHGIQIEPGSLMSELFQPGRLEVNSSHHQAIGRLARMLRVTGRSDDGIIEALELEAAHSAALPYLLAVQFHPERLIRRMPRFLAMFQSFVNASGEGVRKTE